LTGTYDDGGLVLETHANLGENSTDDNYATLGGFADWVADGAQTPIVNSPLHSSHQRFSKSQGPGGPAHNEIVVGSQCTSGADVIDSPTRSSGF
jgi:hypothetical protein